MQHASLDGGENLLESMKERLEFLEKNPQLWSTQVQVETQEKKLELYIVKNDRLLQENLALTQRVETLEEQLTSKVKILITDVSDMQKKLTIVKRKCINCLNKISPISFPMKIYLTPILQKSRERPFLTKEYTPASKKESVGMVSMHRVITIFADLSA